MSECSGSIRRIFPRSVAEVLAVPLRVAAGAAVAEADEQVAVVVEEEQAAVVVGVRLVDFEQRPGGALVGLAVLLGLVLDHPRVAVRVRVVDVEEARSRVVRCEGDREEPLLAAGGDLVGDVEQGGLLAAGRDADDLAGLLDHVERAVALGLRDEDRVLELADLLERDSATALRLAAVLAAARVGHDRRPGYLGLVLFAARGDERETRARARSQSGCAWPCER